MKTYKVFGIALLAVFCVVVVLQVCFTELRAGGEPRPLWAMTMNSMPSAQYEIMFHPADSTVSRKFYSAEKPRFTGRAQCVIEFTDTYGDEHTLCGCWIITRAKTQ